MWLQVLLQMVHGPELTLRGVITSRNGADAPGHDMNWAVVGAENLPVFTGDDDVEVHRVWRDGPRLRVERPDDSPVLIADTDRAWAFDDGNPHPRLVRRPQVWAGGSGTHLLLRREAQEWLDDDFTRPTGPCGSTTFLGREAWTVELAPPARKPHPVQLVVDARTGVVLQQRVDAVGAVDEWTELVVGEALDDGLFTWDGAVRDDDAEREQGVAEDKAHGAELQAWFAANVGPVALSIDITLDLSVQWVHTHDPVTGEFEADLGGGVASLARRPRSDRPWERHWHGDQHTWVAGGFDWAVMLYEHPLPPARLLALQQQLGAEPEQQP